MTRRQSGFSLIEVMMVVVLLAVAAVGTQMFAPISATQSMLASMESRKLVAALRMTRQTALTSQAPVRLRLLGSTQSITGYVVEADVGGKFIPLTRQENLSGLSRMTSSASSIVFQPTGSADISLDVLFGTGRQNHLISVIAGTGMVRYVRS